MHLCAHATDNSATNLSNKVNKKAEITINHLRTALFNFFCGCSEVRRHLYQSTDCTSRPRERTQRQVFYIGQQTALYRHAIFDKVHKNKADTCLIITSLSNASITAAVKAPHFRQGTPTRCPDYQLTFPMKTTKNNADACL